MVEACQRTFQMAYPFGALVEVGNINSIEYSILS